MKMPELTREYLNLLTVQQIKKYLTENGWKQECNLNSKYELFVKTSETGVEYTVALAETSFKSKIIMEALETIASFNLMDVEAVAVMISNYRTLQPDLIFFSAYAGDKNGS